MSNRKSKRNAIYMYDENGEKVLIGKFRINTDLSEKAQVKQGVEIITELMNMYYLKKSIDKVDELIKKVDELKAENEQLKARVKQ